jgi:AbiV family abortive infection protein
MRKALSIDQLKTGRLKPLQNAQELLKEASILFDNGCWARTVFLSQIVGEEIGKYMMLTSALVKVIIRPESFNWDKFWHRYLSHKAKTQNIFVFEDIVHKKNKNVLTYFTKLPRVLSRLERLKQTSLYSDCIGNNFYSPTNLFTKEMATEALNLAKGRMKLFNELERKSLFFVEEMTTEAFRERILAFRNKFIEIIGDNK